MRMKYKRKIYKTEINALNAVADIGDGQDVHEDDIRNRLKCRQGLQSDGSNENTFDFYFSLFVLLRFALISISNTFWIACIQFDPKKKKLTHLKTKSQHLLSLNVFENLWFWPRVKWSLHFLGCVCRVKYLLKMELRCKSCGSEVWAVSRLKTNGPP